MKKLTVLGVFVVVLGLWMPLPAMADPDLVGNIQAFSAGFACANGDTITVLGTAVAIVVPPGTVFTGAPCSDLDVGDRVKVGCTSNSCGTAAYVAFDPISAESSVSSACAGALPTNFGLSNGVFCHISSTTQVKDKKNRTGFGPTPTPAQLCTYLGTLTQLPQLSTHQW